MNAAIVTAALTGPIATKADNPALPTSPEEIAAEARAAWEAGASVLHVHLRDAAGRPTGDLEIARRVVGLIEQACPALIQLSTGVGLGVPFATREQLVETRPAMATLNLCSMTFGNDEFHNPPDGVRRLASRMRELGVKPELEIYDSGHVEMARELLREDILEAPLQFSLVLGVRGGMAASADNIVHVVRQLPTGSVWQVIGIGRHNTAMTAIGLAMGGNARTGLEDTLMLRRGEPAPGNAALVTRLVDVAHALERPVANVEQTRELLGLRPGSTDAPSAS